MVAKYHSHTILVINITVTKHPSHNLSHPHHNAKYQFMPLATVTMATNYLSIPLQSPSYCVYPITTLINLLNILVTY